MATLQFYNHTAHLFMSGAVSDTDTFNTLLLNESAVFDATDTTVSEVSSAGANEVYGGGWTQGGLELTGVSITTVVPSGAKLDADNVSQIITGLDLGPIAAYVIVDSTLSGSAPLAYITLTSPVTVLQNTAAEITWDEAGIFTLAPGGA